MARNFVASQKTRIETLSQRARRVIAVASLLALPAMFGWSAFWLRTSVPNILWGPVSFVLIFVTVAGAFVLYAFVRDRATYGAHLDERQRALRDRAWVLSYEVLAVVVVVVVAVLGVMVLAMGNDVTLDGGFVSGLAICTGVLIPLLPVAALAWVEPDLPAEV